MADFVPLFQETNDTIRARMDADANAGLTTSDPDWLDTREGSFFYDLTESVVLELSRIWDALSTEVPAAAFPTHAWGEYLDDHAETFNLTRKAATQSTGTVTISGAAGATISAGTVFATVSTSPDLDPVEFSTTGSVTLSSALAAPTGVSGTASGTGGSIPAGSYYYFVTASSAFGETTPSTASSVVAVTSGQQVTVSWTAVTGAVSYFVYRASSATATSATLLGTASATTFVDAGASTSTAVAPTVNKSAGASSVTVQAVEPAKAGNVAANAITDVVTDNSNIYAVTNPLATAGGTDVETDDALRERILLEYNSQGAGTQADYRRWALSYTGVGNATVVPTWNGTGTVLVVVMDSSNQPVQSTGTVDSGNIVLGLQTQLDPTRLDSGTSTSVTSTTLVDSTKAWTTDQWKNCVVISGTSYGTYGVVTGNTSTTLTVSSWKTVGTNAAASTPSTGAYIIGSSTSLSGGLGLAPIGAAVTVKTPTVVTVPIWATVTVKPGYSVSTETASLTSALQDYFATLGVGDDVIYRQVLAAILRSEGIADVKSLYVKTSTSTTDATITDNLEIAALGDITVSL